MVSGGRLDCSGTIAVSNLVVTTGASQSLTLDGKLDIVLRF
jgi:hypothetical protein